MKLVRVIAVAAAVAAVLSGTAAAQQSTAPARRPMRGYLIGGGGASIEPNRTPTLSAEIAENVHRKVQFYANIAFYDNLMPDVTRDQLETVAQLLTVSTGTPWELSGRDRGRSFTFGAKYLFSNDGGLVPYLGGAFGVINLRRTVSERVRGNLTVPFLAEFGAEDGVIDVTQTNTNKPLGEIAAGVGMVVKKAYIDFGYRYRSTFHTHNVGFDVSNFGVSAGIKF